LARLDNRTVPKPDNYDVASGQSFPEFLKTFEDYCRNNFRGSSTLWTSELGRFLEGSIHKAYIALRVPGDCYEAIKRKLLKWYKDSHDVISHDTMKRFEKAQMKLHESLWLYATRLERAFRLAYPSRNVEYSKTLRRKFIGTVSKSFRKHLTTAQSIRRMNGQDLTWSNILSLSSEQDAQANVTDTAEEPEEIEVLACAPPLVSDPSRRSMSLGRAHDSHQTKGNSKPFQFSSAAQEFHPSSDVRNSGAFNRSASAHPLSRSSFRSSTGGRTCYYCKRVGHVKANCRRLNGLCLACGSADHRIAACPHRQTLASMISSQTPTASSPRPRVTFSSNVNRGEDTSHPSQSIVQPPLNC